MQDSYVYMQDNHVYIILFFTQVKIHIVQLNIYVVMSLQGTVGYTLLVSSRIVCDRGFQIDH